MNCLLPNSIDILFELVLYIITDNITKFIVIHSRKQHRFNILIGECFLFGFLAGFISVYHHLTYLLLFLLLIHIIGTLHTEQRLIQVKQQIKSIGRISVTCLIEFFHILINAIRECWSNFFRRRRSFERIQTTTTKKTPNQHLYNYHLKPTSDPRLQQSTFVQTSSPRPGIYNLHGTTCSLNALLQSLASLNNFNMLLQRNINLSRINYDPLVPAFLDLMGQLRNEHRALEHKQWNTLVDTTTFISKLNTIYPDLLTKNTMTDICEVFQSIIDALNNALAKPPSVYSSNVIGQVQNRTLTTFSLDYLNKLFAETEAQLHDNITLDNLDAQTSYIIQYVDVTWLLHHIQLGSIIKQTFSGQILHAHCCNNCSHVHFRTEPFQIFTLPVNTTATIEQIFSQLTNIELIDSTACSNCASQITNNNNSERLPPFKHTNFLTKIASTLSPIVNSHSQASDRVFSSTPLSSPAMTHRIRSTMKSQMMLANFPEVLCVQLKRFIFDRLSRITRKLKTHVLIEPEKCLDLSHLHYTSSLGVLPTLLPFSYRYRLVAVCLHLSRENSSSSMNNNNGHSVCLYRTDSSRWFLSDDERITEIHQIDKLFQSSYVTENCYLLFYERCP